jgi:CheY-like chemotaxis protein
VVRVSELISRNEEIGYVLTDFMMPRLNGLQAVAKMKAFIQSRNAIS